MSSDLPQHNASDSATNDTQSPTQSTHENQENTAEVLTTSIDSSTLLLGPATPTEEETIHSPKLTRKNTDVKKCWICYADETEDTANTSRWRSPCSCSLVAHETCLLDWVAELESPTSSRTPSKIQCPQCKKDIKVARPKSYVVQLTKAVERLGSRFSVPGIVVVLASGVYASATMHGITSMYFVFGREQFKVMLGGNMIHPVWLFALPFIPIGLVLSRTTLVDGILPTIPIVIYATGLPQTLIGTEMVPLWPPSLQMAAFTLPFVRNVYRHLWRTMFAEKEAEWTRIMQPRAGATGDGAAAGQENAVANEDEIDHFNLEIAIIDEDNNAAEADAAPGVAAQAGNAAGADEIPANQARGRQAQRQISFTGTHVADLIMGALVFPAVASAMGELLKLGLPASWVTPPIVGRIGGMPILASRRGFLQSKWARTLVGGCLFIVMRDSLFLYSKYRMARDHQKRRIRNWDKTREQYVDDAP